MTTTHRTLLYSRDVAALLTRMDPKDQWDERRARRWMQRPIPWADKKTVAPPGFKLSGAWVTTIERLKQAFPDVADEAAERAAERALEAEQAGDCEGCSVLRARLLEVERELANAVSGKAVR